MYTFSKMCLPHTRIKRFVCFILVFSFVVEQGSWAATSPGQVNQVNQVNLSPVFGVSPEHAMLQEFHAGTNGRFVIHIQDPHANLSGQKNLSAALEEILKDHSVKLVLAEGGAGDCSLTPLKTIAPPEVWQRVAKSYLMQGLISGEEYLNLTSSHPMKIIGVEDMELYDQSVAAYRELAAGRERALEELARIRGAVERLKRKLYPSELCAYEEEKTKRGDTGIQALLPLLEAAAIARYPSLERLRQVMETEKGLNFQAARLEQTALIEQIADWATSGELLMQGKPASQFAHFQNTLKRAQVKNIALSGYVHFLEYGKYLEAFTAIPLDQVLKEADAAEEALYASRLEGPARLVRSVDRYAALLDRAYRIQMTTDEFERFRLNEADFPLIPTVAFLNRAMADAGDYQNFLAEPKVLEEGLASAVRFYELAAERDLRFVSHLERIMEEQKESRAVLITGGYHTPHLKKLLAAKGYSYAVVTPVVESETVLAKYERRLIGPLKTNALRFRATAMSPGVVDPMATDAARFANTDEARLERALEEVRGARLADIPNDQIITIIHKDGTRWNVLMKKDYGPSGNNFIFRAARNPVQKDVTGGFDKDLNLPYKFGVYVDLTDEDAINRLVAQFGGQIRHDPQGKLLEALKQVLRDRYVFYAFEQFFNDDGRLNGWSSGGKYDEKPLALNIGMDKDSWGMKKTLLHELMHYVLDKMDSNIAAIKRRGGADHSIIGPMEERFSLALMASEKVFKISDRLVYLHYFLQEGQLGPEVDRLIDSDDKQGLSALLASSRLVDHYVTASVLTPVSYVYFYRGKLETEGFPEAEIRSDKGSGDYAVSDEITDIAHMNAYHAWIINESLRMALRLSSEKGMTIRAALQTDEFRQSFVDFVRRFSDAMTQDPGAPMPLIARAINPEGARLAAPGNGWEPSEGEIQYVRSAAERGSFMGAMLYWYGLSDPQRKKVDEGLDAETLDRLRVFSWLNEAIKGEVTGPASALDIEARERRFQELSAISKAARSTSEEPEWERLRALFEAEEKMLSVPVKVYPIQRYLTLQRSGLLILMTMLVRDRGFIAPTLGSSPSAWMPRKEAGVDTGFYVLLDRNVSGEDFRRPEYHPAYVVPEESDRVLVRAILHKAEEAGHLDAGRVKLFSDRIKTYADIAGRMKRLSGASGARLAAGALSVDEMIIDGPLTSQGRRPQQQDAYLNEPVILKKGSGRVMLVADGSGLYGEFFAQLARDRFMRFFIDALAATDDPKRALLEAFANVQKEARQIPQIADDSGTTLSVVFLGPKKDDPSRIMAYAAVLGDSPVIIQDVTGRHVMRIHNLVTDTAARVFAKSQGLVKADRNGVERLQSGDGGYGVLPTRGIGYAAMTDAFGRTPDVQEFELGPGGFAAVMTDGVVEGTVDVFEAGVGQTARRIEGGAQAKELVSDANEDNNTIIIARVPSGARLAVPDYDSAVREILRRTEGDEQLYSEVLLHLNAVIEGQERSRMATLDLEAMFDAQSLLEEIGLQYRVNVRDKKDAEVLWEGVFRGRVSVPWDKDAGPEKWRTGPPGTYYQVLGIDPSATPLEIHRAFRLLALRHHPDKNRGSKEAEAMFKAVLEAYEVLKNPDRKAQYDAFGRESKGSRLAETYGAIDWTLARPEDIKRDPAKFGLVKRIGAAVGTRLSGIPMTFPGVRALAYAQEGDGLRVNYDGVAGARLSAADIAEGRAELRALSEVRMEKSADDVIAASALGDQLAVRQMALKVLKELAVPGGSMEIVNVDSFDDPEYAGVLARQARDFEKFAQMDGRHIIFYSRDKVLQRKLNEGMKRVDWASIGSFMYHSDVATIGAEAERIVREALKDAGYEAPADFAFGYMPFQGGKGAIMPIEGAVALSVSVGRMNVEEPDAFILSPLASALRIPDIKGLLTKEGLSALKRFDPLFKKYAGFAIPPVAKLDIDQMLSYVRGARLAIAKSA